MIYLAALVALVAVWVTAGFPVVLMLLAGVALLQLAESAVARLRR